MLIGVVSDSHGHVEFTLNAVRVLQQFAIQTVIHCGDIGSPDIPPLFSDWPTHYVLGNVDRNEDDLCTAIEESGGTLHGRFGSLRIGVTSIAFLHGDDSGLFQQTVQSKRWDLICCGHTHEAEQRQVGKTKVLNPGAIYRANPHSVAVVELPQLDITQLLT